MKTKLLWKLRISPMRSITLNQTTPTNTRVTKFSSKKQCQSNKLSQKTSHTLRPLISIKMWLNTRRWIWWWDPLVKFLLRTLPTRTSTRTVRVMRSSLMNLWSLRTWSSASILKSNAPGPSTNASSRTLSCTWVAVITYLNFSRAILITDNTHHTYSH